ncbi:MAG: hypothetical protein Q9186_005012 [Xanthomendoza sp. 1 TL-2023]
MSNNSATLSENNQTYFDDFASSTKRPSWIIDLWSQITAEIHARRDWIGISTSFEDGSTDGNNKTYNFRLLDYACGEGTLSRNLFNYVDEAWGIDLSAGMVKSYNGQAAALGIPKGKKMVAVQGDLLSPSIDDHNGTSFAAKEWFDFDLAIMSMALHHLASPEDAVRALVRRVKEGRSVIFIDFVSGSMVRRGECQHGVGQCGHGHGTQDLPGAHTRTRDGFEEEEMKKMLVDAGCDEVGFAEFGDLTRMEFGDQVVVGRLFLAKGKRARKSM